MLSDKIWMWHFILFSVLKLKMPFKKPDFTIDDAFSESAEDKIRLYTRTSESVPLTEETIQVQFNQSLFITTCHNCRKSLLGSPTLQVPRVIQKQFLWAALPAQRQTPLLSKPRPFRIPPFRWSAWGLETNNFYREIVIFLMIFQLTGIEVKGWRFNFSRFHFPASHQPWLLLGPGAHLKSLVSPPKN